MKYAHRFAIAFVLLLSTVPAVAQDGLSVQDRQMLDSANAAARELGNLLDGWIRSGKVTEDQLFARLYYPIENTNPPKFNTDWDALSDQEVQPIIERYAGADSRLSSVILTDLNGYVATHNAKFSRPLTGNAAEDLTYNRTKRIFADKVGINASRNTAPYLVQHYVRDSGETVADLSVPVIVKGKHWGCVRFDYQIVNN